ncbi:MAG: tetratricopeptide repeat protein [Syntrophales bacterium]
MEINPDFQDGLKAYVLKDYATAFKKLQPLAASGNAKSQHMLGELYIVTQDYRQAADWMRKAAEQGDDEAQTNMSDMYCSGLGVTQDYQQAEYRFRKAVEQGYARAQNNLGV